MENESKTKRYRIRFANLRNDQTSWRNHWQDIADFMIPRRGRYLYSEDDEPASTKGEYKYNRIINGTGGEALKILASGMQGGLTSPSRPWFVLSMEDKDLAKYAPVKQWLTDVRDRVLAIYARSNFYGSMHSVYKELGAFGVSAQLQLEDYMTVCRFRPFTAGEFLIELDSAYRPSALFRHFSLTADQMIQEFGKEKVSSQVIDAQKTHNNTALFKVVNVIEPNKLVNPAKAGYEGMTYKSIYYQDDGDPDMILRESGFDGLPFIAPRWDVTATEIYGNSPAMEALGDIRMLQKMEEKTLKAIDKMVDPPMNADVSLKNKGGSIVPGHVNYISSMQGGVGFSPVYQINPNVQQLEYKIDRVEQRIKRFFFNDLFLMIVNDQRSNTTAYEIAKKHEEKLLMLGPVIERIQNESHNPTIDRTFLLAEKLGLLPEPPDEIKGVELKVEYVSILAQAQKMVGTTSIEQTASFVGNLGSVNPEALDLLDVDAAVQEYASLTGAPPKMIRDEAAVKAMREARMRQQQMAQANQTIGNTVDNAKTMSDTKLNDESALNQLITGITGS